MPNNCLLTIAIIALFILPILPSCQTAVASSDDWPMYQHDPAHTGAIPTQEQIFPVYKWNNTVLAHGIAVSNGLAYCLMSYKTIVIFDCKNASTGTPVWHSLDVPPYTYSQITPAVVDDVVYIDTAAYNSTTGQKIIDYSIYNGTTSPTVADGLIFMGGNTDSGSAYVFAVDTQTGKLQWNSTEIIGTFNGYYSADYIIQCPVAVLNSMAYFASGRGVYAVNEKTGNLIWNYPLPDFLSNCSGTVIVTESNVFACISDQLYCIDALTGVKVWNTTAEGFLALSNDIIIAGDSAYNISSGENIWSLGLDNLSAPAITGDVIYYSHAFSYDHNSDKFKHELLGVNASTGKTFWSYPLLEDSYQITGSLALANKMLYSSDLKQVLAFDLVDSAPATTTTKTDLIVIPLIAAAVIILIIALIAILVWRKSVRKLS